MKIMRINGRVPSTTPLTLMAMGVVASRMHTCRGGRKGGGHGKDKVGGAIGKEGQ